MLCCLRQGYVKYDYLKQLTWKRSRLMLSALRDGLCVFGSLSLPQVLLFHVTLMGIMALKSSCAAVASQLRLTC